MQLIFNTTFIIRTAGERTLELCKKLILEQGVPELQIYVVNEVPFSAAMLKSFEIGLKLGRKWTFCIDADVLLRPGSVLNMIQKADEQADNVCEIQGLVIDKFFGGPRPAGNHLYRTSLLPEAVKHLPEEGNDIRPEYHMLQRMASEGYPWMQIPYIIGTHDDEQFNFDIYRKCFIQAEKHLCLADMFVPIWKRNMDSDPDFKVALVGFANGILNHKKLYVNTELPIYKEGFIASGIEEKAVLIIERYSSEIIERTINFWEDADEYSRRFPGRFGLNQLENKSRNSKRLHRFKTIIEEKGFLQGLMNIFGRCMTFFGIRIMNRF